MELEGGYPLRTLAPPSKNPLFAIFLGGTRTMRSDIEIAQEAELKPIQDIAKSIGIDLDDLELYGKYKAKLTERLYAKTACRPDGKLILVTAINPTPAGEGKTTISVGLGQAMQKIGKKAILALREPSLGPVFGIKGGAAGGGYSQVLPMEDLNLHFTGDIHAITTANNLLCALLDNHLQQGNALQIDTRRIVFKRCLDMNDRALRQTIVGLGGKLNGVPREDGFQISVASEVMAILCLASDLADLKERLGNILVAYTIDGKPVYARDLQAQGAMTALLKDAIKPNLVQTLEHTPVLIHGGPFANIAHGCNSIRATKLALKLADYTITEAGFGSDLGAEKFFDIKCRYGGLTPSCVVLVATVRALKYNGGMDLSELATPDVDALKRGIINLRTHIENMQSYHLPVVVALNQFHTDSEEELAFIEEYCKKLGVDTSRCEVFAKGGDGGRDLATKVCEAIELCADNEASFRLLYKNDLSISRKVETVAKQIYHADGVKFLPQAAKTLQEIEELGYGKLPICIAKTQYSFSDNPKLLGKPEGFVITVRDVRLSAGAGFVILLTGSIMTMPGLPKKPAAFGIDCDQDGNISGLF